MPVYVDADNDRGADEGGGFRMGYGRSLDSKWYWESDLFGGVLETGNPNITDFYQLGVSTGLSWSLYDRDPSHWTPYLIGMVGAMYNDGQPDSRDGVDLTLGAGVGAVSKSLFDNGIRLRAEARYLYDTYTNDQTDLHVSVGIEIPLRGARVVEKVVYIDRFHEFEREVPVMVTVYDPDSDGDGDDVDNCPARANAEQGDQDLDGVGDVCDDDIDGDGVGNDTDNCVRVANPDQIDTDVDGIGDACFAGTDNDADGIDDGVDNCPAVFNPAQGDADNDGIGDACDMDSDGDGISDAVDNCPLVANADQADVDGDGIGDVCDTAFSCTASSAYPPLLAINGAQVSTGTTGGLLCLLCSGSNSQRVIDDDGASAADLSTAATLSTPVALLGGSVYFDITSPLPFNGDNRVGFVLSEPDSLLSLGLLEGTTISLFLGATEVERFEGSSLLDLDLLGLMANPSPAFVSADTSATFDRVRIEFSSLVGALSTLNVHASCVGPTP